MPQQKKNKCFDSFILSWISFDRFARTIQHKIINYFNACQLPHRFEQRNLVVARISIDIWHRQFENVNETRMQIFLRTNSTCFLCHRHLTGTTGDRKQKKRAKCWMVSIRCVMLFSALRRFRWLSVVCVFSGPFDRRRTHARLMTFVFECDS